MAYRSFLNQVRSYNIHPAKLCLGPPLGPPPAGWVRGSFLWQLTPPPYSQPKSPVSEKGHLVGEPFRMVVVLDFDAVVGVDAGPAQRNRSSPQSVFAHAVVVENHGNPGLRTVQDLPTQARFCAQSAIGLPAVDDPGLDLELVSGKPLDAQSIEEPRRVGRNERRLIGPVVKVVVAEQTDVGDEDSGVDIEPVVHVKVIPAVGFGKIFVRATEIPLPASRARVVARGRDCKHSSQSQDPAANVLPVKVPAETDLLHLDFVRAEDLGRSSQCVILGMIEAAYEVSIESDFRGEEFGIPHRIFVARRAIQPSPIGIGKWLARRPVFRFGGGRVACRLCNRLPPDLSPAAAGVGSDFAWRRGRGSRRRRGRCLTLQFCFELFDARLHDRQFFGDIKRDIRIGLGGGPGGRRCRAAWCLSLWAMVRAGQPLLVARPVESCACA